MQLSGGATGSSFASWQLQRSSQSNGQCFYTVAALTAECALLVSPADGLTCVDGVDADPSEFMLVDDGFGSGRVLVLADRFALAGAARGSDVVLAPVAMEEGGTAGRGASEHAGLPAAALIRLVDLAYGAWPGLARAGEALLLLLLLLLLLALLAMRVHW